MIPTEGKMRKVHHALSTAMKLKKCKMKRQDALKQLKDQYMLDNEQTCVVWHAAELAKNKPENYASYDDVIREARQAGVEVETIPGKHDRLTDPNTVTENKPKQKSKAEKKTEKKATPKQAPKEQEKQEKAELEQKEKKPKAKKQPKKEQKEENELFSFE
jgi:DNA-binding transcriptional regulator of glucitol operon